MFDSKKNQRPAILALADGSIFSGTAIGAIGQTVGEVVFNTSMTGYQEILTDPSYTKQIITLTCPHIGNVGVNRYDMESNKIWAAGLVISKLSPIYSSWRAETSLDDFLKQQQLVAIADIDTRRLTRVIRETGAQSGCIITEQANIKTAINKAKQCASLHGQDLAKEVTINEPYVWESDTDRLTNDIVVYDFGVKHQILRLLADRNCRLTVVPATTTAADVLAMNPAGVFLSNGPGDPSACQYAIHNIQTLLKSNIPMFGICLGFQLLALACGGKTFKMKFGHHGANHPVQNVKTKVVYITSQNHGFAVDEASLPAELAITHRSLFDDTLQGIRHKTKPAIAFQGHPEASPGPHDLSCLFDEFMRLINAKT